MDLKEYSGRGDVNLHLVNAEDYLTAPKQGYSPPPIPVEIPSFTELKSEREEFGKRWMKHFHLTEEFTFVNHGALGLSLKESLATSQAFQRYVDSQPLRAIDREIVPLVCHVKREMAEFIGCEARDIFFIENCTAGISTIINSIPFSSGDKIVTLSVGYGAVGYGVDLVCERTGAEHHKIQVDLPVLGPEEIVERVKMNMCEGAKLAIFDHFPTNAAFLIPIQELIDFCRSKGILVLIDGAHSLGQIEVNISSYDADFYVMNCHKWLSNTRGSAVGYVRRELQQLVRPLVVSWGHNRGFSAEFTWNGTQYYSQFVSLLSTLNFWKAVGPQVIRDYCSATVKQAAKMCCESWGVEPVCPEDMIGMMALVRLPDRLNDKKWTPEGMKKELILDSLYYDYKIEVPIREADGVLYTRLSCHVYNQMSDYEEVCAAILEICEKRDSLVNYNSKFKRPSAHM